MDKLKLSSEWILQFIISDLNITFSVNLKTKEIILKNDPNIYKEKVQILTIPSGYLNKHFTFHHHWNN